MKGFAWRLNFDYSKDVQAAILRKPIPLATTIPCHLSASRSTARESSQKQIKAAIHRVGHLINIAKKPIIYAGQGILAIPEGPRLLREFADKACIPVTTSLLGFGTFNELDEKAPMMLGMHNLPNANLAIPEADLIITLGARSDDPVTENILR